MAGIEGLRFHNGTMPSIQIKDVPEQTHAVLRRRAAAAHQSLPEYFRARLIERGSAADAGGILDRPGGSVPLQAAVDAISDDRAGR
jgi:hypothetical protein